MPRVWGLGCSGWRRLWGRFGPASTASERIRSRGSMRGSKRIYHVPDALLRAFERAKREADDERRCRLNAPNRSSQLWYSPDEYGGALGESKTIVSNPVCRGDVEMRSPQLAAFFIQAFMQCRPLAVRPEGANHQCRKIAPRECSVDLVADEWLGRVTGRAGAS